MDEVFRGYSCLVPLCGFCVTTLWGSCLRSLPFSLTPLLIYLSCVSPSLYLLFIFCFLSLFIFAFLLPPPTTSPLTISHLWFNLSSYSILHVALLSSLTFISLSNYLKIMLFLLVGFFYSNILDFFIIPSV